MGHRRRARTREYYETIRNINAQERLIGAQERAARAIKKSSFYYEWDPLNNCLVHREFSAGMHIEQKINFGDVELEPNDNISKADYDKANDAFKEKKYSALDTQAINSGHKMSDESDINNIRGMHNTKHRTSYFDLARNHTDPWRMIYQNKMNPNIDIPKVDAPTKPDPANPTKYRYVYSPEKHSLIDTKDNSMVPFGDLEVFPGYSVSEVEYGYANSLYKAGGYKGGSILDNDKVARDSDDPWRQVGYEKNNPSTEEEQEEELTFPREFVTSSGHKVTIDASNEYNNIRTFAEKGTLLNSNVKYDRNKGIYVFPSGISIKTSDYASIPFKDRPALVNQFGGKMAEPEPDEYWSESGTRVQRKRGLPRVDHKNNIVVFHDGFEMPISTFMQKGNTTEGDNFRNATSIEHGNIWKTKDQLIKERATPTPSPEPPKPKPTPQTPSPTPSPKPKINTIKNVDIFDEYQPDRYMLPNGNYVKKEYWDLISPETRREILHANEPKEGQGSLPDHPRAPGYGVIKNDKMSSKKITVYDVGEFDDMKQRNLYISLTGTGNANTHSPGREFWVLKSEWNSASKEEKDKVWIRTGVKTPTPTPAPPPTRSPHPNTWPKPIHTYSFGVNGTQVFNTSTIPNEYKKYFSTLPDTRYSVETEDYDNLKASERRGLEQIYPPTPTPTPTPTPIPTPTTTTSPTPVPQPNTFRYMVTSDKGITVYDKVPYGEKEADYEHLMDQHTHPPMSWGYIKKTDYNTLNEHEKLVLQAQRGIATPTPTPTPTPEVKKTVQTPGPTPVPNDYPKPSGTYGSSFWGSGGIKLYKSVPDKYKDDFMLLGDKETYVLKKDFDKLSPQAAFNLNGAYPTPVPTPTPKVEQPKPSPTPDIKKEVDRIMRTYQRSDSVLPNMTEADLKALIERTAASTAANVTGSNTTEYSPEAIKIALKKIEDEKIENDRVKKELEDAEAAEARKVAAEARETARRERRAKVVKAAEDLGYPSWTAQHWENTGQGEPASVKSEFSPKAGEDELRAEPIKGDTRGKSSNVLLDHVPHRKPSSEYGQYALAERKGYEDRRTMAERTAEKDYLANIRDSNVDAKAIAAMRERNEERRNTIQDVKKYFIRLAQRQNNPEWEQLIRREIDPELLKVIARVNKAETIYSIKAIGVRYATMAQEEENRLKQTDKELKTAIDDHNEWVLADTRNAKIDQEYRKEFGRAYTHLSASQRHAYDVEHKNIDNYQLYKKGIDEGPEARKTLFYNYLDKFHPTRIHNHERFYIGEDELRRMHELYEPHLEELGRRVAENKHRKGYTNRLLNYASRNDYMFPGENPFQQFDIIEEARAKDKRAGIRKAMSKFSPEMREMVEKEYYGTDEQGNRYPKVSFSKLMTKLHKDPAFQKLLNEHRNGLMNEIITGKYDTTVHSNMLKYNQQDFEKYLLKVAHEKFDEYGEESIGLKDLWRATKKHLSKEDIREYRIKKYGEDIPDKYERQNRRKLKAKFGVIKADENGNYYGFTPGGPTEVEPEWIAEQLRGTWRTRQSNKQTRQQMLDVVKADPYLAEELTKYENGHVNAHNIPEYNSGGQHITSEHRIRKIPTDRLQELYGLAKIRKQEAREMALSPMFDPEYIRLRRQSSRPLHTLNDEELEEAYKQGIEYTERNGLPKPRSPFNAKGYPKEGYFGRSRTEQDQEDHMMKDLMSAFNRIPESARRQYISPLENLQQEIQKFITEKQRNPTNQERMAMMKAIHVKLSEVSMALGMRSGLGDKLEGQTSHSGIGKGDFSFLEPEPPRVKSTSLVPYEEGGPVLGIDKRGNYRQKRYDMVADAQPEGPYRRKLIGTKPHHPGFVLNENTAALPTDFRSTRSSAVRPIDTLGGFNYNRFKDSRWLTETPTTGSETNLFNSNRKRELRAVRNGIQPHLRDVFDQEMIDRFGTRGNPAVPIELGSTGYQFPGIATPTPSPTPQPTATPKIGKPTDDFQLAATATPTPMPTPSPTPQPAEQPWYSKAWGAIGSHLPWGQKEDNNGHPGTSVTMEPSTDLDPDDIIYQPPKPPSIFSPLEGKGRKIAASALQGGLVGGVSAGMFRQQPKSSFMGESAHSVAGKRAYNRAVKFSNYATHGVGALTGALFNASRKVLKHSIPLGIGGMLTGAGIAGGFLGGRHYIQKRVERNAGLAAGGDAGASRAAAMASSIQADLARDRRR
jgi:hypothetical protein